MKPIANLVHSVPGRVRLKISAARGDAAYFERLAETLRQTPGVSAFDVRVATGSVLIAHAWESVEELLRLAESTDLFELRPFAFEPLWQRAADGMQRLHARMSSFTRGEIGLRSALLLGLTGMGVAQVLRGRIMPPAAALLLEALRLVGVPEEPRRTVNVRPPS